MFELGTELISRLWSCGNSGGLGSLGVAGIPGGEKQGTALARTPESAPVWRSCQDGLRL